MRRYAWISAARLGLALLVGLAGAAGPKPGTCNGDFGTSVLFEDTPKEAAARALKEEKLVFVLHISGHFEDPKLT